LSEKITFSGRKITLRVVEKNNLARRFFPSVWSRESVARVFVLQEKLAKTVFKIQTLFNLCMPGDIA
jgi:hypothetical protein